VAQSSAANDRASPGADDLQSILRSAARAGFPGNEYWPAKNGAFFVVPRSLARSDESNRGARTVTTGPRRFRAQVPRSPYVRSACPLAARS
jgi:hypothetical protein